MPINRESSKPRLTKVAPKKHGATRLVASADADLMVKRLMRRYPNARCELNYRNEYELLIAVILSAQTTDVQVNKVTPALFKRFPTPQALAAADQEEVKSIVKPTGYYNTKARTIQACGRMLAETFAGRVPDGINELTSLPGVGRKTANVVLGVVHGHSGWTVDTHVRRLSQRLGFSKQTNPYKIELDLQKLFAGQDWSRLSITLIWHGRRICFARKPNCADCPISDLCPSSTA